MASHLLETCSKFNLWWDNTALTLTSAQRSAVQVGYIRHFYFRLFATCGAENVGRPTTPVTLTQHHPPSLRALAMPSTATSSNFQAIFDAALSDYAKQTGIDLATHPFAQTLQSCYSADEIFNLFRDKANQFRAYRDGNRKLINCLKPVVQVLHTVTGILGEAASLVRPMNRLALYDCILTALFPGTISTYKSNSRWRRCPPHRVYDLNPLGHNLIISGYSRRRSESVQVTTLWSIYLNASPISSIVYEYIPRSLSPLQCLV
jgi:fungal STAND N-terminal Goodbye domain